jgi:glutamate racemase
LTDRNAPIGIFDSGVGGLTVAREIFARLPKEQTIYFGDDGRFPYGSRPPSEVQCFAMQILELLLGYQVKMVVVACNTVSALALPQLAKRSTVPIIGVIEDTARYVATLSKRGKIGILATPGTVQSGAYPRAFQAINPALVVTQIASQPLVNLVENGNRDHPGVKEFAIRTVAPFRLAGVDVLVLGCTHYPYLTRLMEELLGDQATIVDPALAVSLRLEKELKERDLLHEDGEGRHLFLTSGDPAQFLRVGRQMYPQLSTVEAWRWPDERNDETH